jgi:hypothetical protein
VTLTNPALVLFGLTCSQVMVEFLECIDENAARGSLLPATVFNRAQDRAFLSLTAHRMFSAPEFLSFYSAERA